MEGILERTKVSKGFLGKVSKRMAAEKREENISAGKLALKKKHRIIGMQNNRFGIYTDCNGEIRRATLWRASCVTLSTLNCCFVSLFYGRFHRSRMSICLLGTIIIYTPPIVFNINSSPFTLISIAV